MVQTHRHTDGKAIALALLDCQVSRAKNYHMKVYIFFYIFGQMVNSKSSRGWRTLSLIHALRRQNEGPWLGWRLERPYTCIIQNKSDKFMGQTSLPCQSYKLIYWLSFCRPHIIHQMIIRWQDIVIQAHVVWPPHFFAVYRITESHIFSHLCSLVILSIGSKDRRFPLTVAS